MSDKEKTTETIPNELEIKAKVLEDELREAKEKAEAMAKQIAIIAEEKKKEVAKLLESAPEPIKKKYSIETINPIEDYGKIQSEIEYHKQLVQQAEQAAKVKYEEIRQQIKKQYGTVLPDVAKIETKLENTQKVQVNDEKTVNVNDVVVDLGEENKWKLLAQKPVLTSDEYRLITRRLSSMSKYINERRKLAISAQNEQ